MRNKEFIILFRKTEKKIKNRFFSSDYLVQHKECLMFQAIKIGLQFLVTHKKMAYVELLFMNEKDSINKSL